MDPLFLLAIPAGFAFVMYKAGTWNPNPSLFAAQKRERGRAAQFASVLDRHFDALDVDKTGLLTRSAALPRVDSLNICDAEKSWLRSALAHVGVETYIAPNPWLLGTLDEKYDFTPIGHVVGRHKETRTAVTGGMYHCSAVPYDVWVDDYAISREDLASYVERVDARRTLAAK